jgi:hypothetical protein
MKKEKGISWNANSHYSINKNDFDKLFPKLNDEDLKMREKLLVDELNTFMENLKIFNNRKNELARKLDISRADVDELIDKILKKENE